MHAAVVAIAEDGRYISGHIGDGVQILVEPNGEMRTFSPPENGEYENETWFITGDDAVEHLRIQKGTLQAGSTLLMMSDGTAKSLYQTSTGEPAPACRTIARWLKEKEEDEVSFLLEKNMNEVFWSRTSDDMSLIVIRVQESRRATRIPICSNSERNEKDGLWVKHHRTAAVREHSQPAQSYLLIRLFLPRGF